VTSPLFAVLARTLVMAHPASGPALLESRAHGTVSLRATFIRTELVRSRMDGEVPMLDAEDLASIEKAAAPEVEIGDMIYAEGALWEIHVALDDGGGLVKLQLKQPQLVTAKADTATLKLAVAGQLALEDLEDGDEIAALTQSTVFRFRQRRTSGAATIVVAGETYQVLAVEAWQGLWRKLTLARAE